MEFLTDPGEGEQSDRIDALLSSALADQARERRTLVETVFGAKMALAKAEEELAGLRELINKRDDSLLEAIAKHNESLMEAVGKNNQALAETISSNFLEAVGAIGQKVESAQTATRDAGLTLRIEGIEEAILQLAERIAVLGELPGQLRRDLEVSAVAIGERVGEESASLLADIREDQVEVVQTLVTMSENEFKELKQNVNSAKREVMERTATAGKDTVEAGRSNVEQMVEHLTGYLQARDEQLYRARDQRLIELFQQLSDTIGRSTKRKIGKTLSEEAGTMKPLKPAQPPAEAPPPLTISRTFRQPREEKPVEAPPSQPFSGRADPAFAFDEPIRRFEPEDLPAPFGTQAPGSPGPNQPFEDPDASLTQAMANPLSRAELVRDYLAESQEEMFLDNPPSRPASRSRRKPPGDELPPAKPRSAPPSRRPPMPPASPRTRRKP